MSETTTYQPAPGITVRQRISVKQTAKGEFQRDYTVEIMGRVVESNHPDGSAALSWVGDSGDYYQRDINDIALQRAEDDWLAHVERIKAGASDD